MKINTEAPVLVTRARGPRFSFAHFFAPRSIAVIGASERAGSVGRALAENLAAFEGEVFSVNPRHRSVLGRPAWARVGELPVTMDLAVIATPAAVVPQIVRECAEAGVKAAIIYAAGFKEAGPVGAELERQVVIEARRNGLRLIGPNCLGLMVPRRKLNATFAPALARAGSVAFISQSGALCSAVLDWSRRENVGLSAFVSVGSMADVGWGDLIMALGDDPFTRSILLYMESIGDARSFLSAAREVAFTKPIIVVKAGRTAAAAKAVAAHTGALPGSDAVMDAAFRRAGVLRVDTIEDLFDLAEVLGKQPRPRGRRLGIVTNAGGPAALAVDRLVAEGGEVAPLTEETKRELDRVLPAGWSHANPVDVLGDADAARFGCALEQVVRDPTADAVLVILTPQAMSEPLATAERIKSIAALAGEKPLLTSWMGGAAVEAGEAVLNAAGIPTFKFPERAAQAFNYMWRYSANLEALYETPTLREAPPKRGDGRPRTDRALAAARRAHRAWLTAQEAKEILADYGIPVVASIPADTESEAVATAAKIGFPVAIKLQSETITAKRAVGGVHLNRRDAAEVRRAWKAIQRGVAETVGEHHFLGVTVERMVATDGIELRLGSFIDPEAGPVLVFGAGGRETGAADDTAIGLPPLTSTLARRLMEQTRVYRLRQRGPDTAPVDWAALEQVLVWFSQLVAEQNGIKEIDLNPLFILADHVVALDARIQLHEPELPAAQWPKLAIRPYPQHYATARTLTDGTPVVLRSIRPEDEPMMVRLHETLSEQSVYYRYFTAVSLEQRTRHARLARLCFIDYDREVALVAVHDNPRTGRSEILGVGRLCKAHGRNEAEFALVVSDSWQRRGLGTLLMGRLVEIGRAEGLTRLTGTILGENHAMRRVCERAGFRLQRPAGQADFVATCVL